MLKETIIACLMAMSESERKEIVEIVTTKDVKKGTTYGDVIKSVHANFTYSSSKASAINIINPNGSSDYYDGLIAAIEDKAYDSSKIASISIINRRFGY